MLYMYVCVVCVWQVIKPKVQRLKALLSEEGASRLCVAMPTIINRDLDKVEARLRALQEVLPKLKVRAPCLRLAGLSC